MEPLKFNEKDFKKMEKLHLESCAHQETIAYLSREMANKKTELWDSIAEIYPQTRKGKWAFDSVNNELTCISN